MGSLDWNNLKEGGDVFENKLGNGVTKNLGLKNWVVNIKKRLKKPWFKITFFLTALLELSEFDVLRQSLKKHD